MMKDTLYPVVGSGSSFFAMLIGVIDVNGLVNAFLFGIAGALGGLFVRYLIRLSKRAFQQLKSNNK